MPRLHDRKSTRATLPLPCEEEALPGGASTLGPGDALGLKGRISPHNTIDRQGNTVWVGLQAKTKEEVPSALRKWFTDTAGIRAKHPQIGPQCQC